MPMWVDWDIVYVDTLFAGGLFEVLHEDLAVASFYHFCFASYFVGGLFPA